MKDLMMCVVFVVLVLLAVFKDTWFNVLTEHTRDPESKSVIVFTELEK